MWNFGEISKGGCCLLFNDGHALPLRSETVGVRRRMNIVNWLNRESNPGLLDEMQWKYPSTTALVSTGSYCHVLSFFLIAHWTSTSQVVTQIYNIVVTTSYLDYRNWGSLFMTRTTVITRIEREKFNTGPGLDPGTPALRTGARTTNLSRASTDPWLEFLSYSYPLWPQTDNLCHIMTVLMIVIASHAIQGANWDPASDPGAQYLIPVELIYWLGILLARRIPHEISEVQQWHCCAVAQALLDRYLREGDDFVGWIVAVDETWLAQTNQTWNANQMNGSIPVLLVQRKCAI